MQPAKIEDDFVEKESPKKVSKFDDDERVLI